MNGRNWPLGPYSILNQQRTMYNTDNKTLKYNTTKFAISTLQNWNIFVILRRNKRDGSVLQYT